MTSEAQFTEAVRLAFEFDHKVVVEQGIKGREIECAVLGNDFHRQAPAVSGVKQRFLLLRHQIH